MILHNVLMGSGPCPLGLGHMQEADQASGNACVYARGIKNSSGPEQHVGTGELLGYAEGLSRQVDEIFSNFF